METILAELRGVTKVDERLFELGPVLHAGTLTLMALILFCDTFHKLGMKAEVAEAVEVMRKV